MVWDTSITITDDTAYVWGGWDESGYRSKMKVFDLVTGAEKEIDLTKVRFQTSGFVINDSWNFTAGKLVYLDTDGTLTQTRPLSGQVTVVGVAWTSTILCLDPRPPISATTTTT